jgi:DNA polymerase III subunit delta'
MQNSDKKEKSGWPLAGNRPITDFLERSVTNGKISHSYIFCGPEDLGKTAAAVFFATCLLCQKQKVGAFSLPCGTCRSCREMRGGKGEIGGFEAIHSDFHLVKKEKDKKNISIEQARELIRILGMSSFSNSYKVGIIKEADDLSEGAANALLKTLEEPRPKVVMILTASRLERIPSTIISRSQVFNFLPVSSGVIYDYLLEKFDCPRTLAKEISRLSLGRPALAAKFFEDKEFYQGYLKKAEIFLDFFQGNLNERINAVAGIAAGEEENEREKSLNILSVWQGVIRDLLLLSANNGDLIQHEPLRGKMSALSRNSNGTRWLKLNRALEEGGKYLRANVNPKLVLENIAISL